MTGFLFVFLASQPSKQIPPKTFVFPAPTSGCPCIFAAQWWVSRGDKSHWNLLHSTLCGARLRWEKIFLDWSYACSHRNLSKNNPGAPAQDYVLFFLVGFKETSSLLDTIVSFFSGHSTANGCSLSPGGLESWGKPTCLQGSSSGSELTEAFGPDRSPDPHPR